MEHVDWWQVADRVYIEKKNKKKLVEYLGHGGRLGGYALANNLLQV